MASNNNKLKKIQRFRLLCFLNNEITQLILGNCPLMCDKVYDLMGTGRWFSIVKMPFAVTLMDMKLRFKKAKDCGILISIFPLSSFNFVRLFIKSTKMQIQPSSPTKLYLRNTPSTTLLIVIFVS